MKRSVEKRLAPEVHTRQTLHRFFMEYMETISDDELLELAEFNPLVHTIRFFSVPGKGLMWASSKEKLPDELHQMRLKYYDSDIKGLKSKVKRDAVRKHAPVKMGRPRKRRPEEGGQ